MDSLTFDMCMCAIGIITAAAGIFLHWRESRGN